MCLSGTASVWSKEMGSGQGTPAQNTSADPLAKPIMGFSTWTRFGCMPQAQLSPAIQLPALMSAGTSMPAPLNEPSPGTSTEEQPYSFQHFMLDQAQSLVESGLSAAGYTYLNVDDCWQALDREKVGSPVNFVQRFKAALTAANVKDAADLKKSVFEELQSALTPQTSKTQQTSPSDSLTDEEVKPLLYSPDSLTNEEFQLLAHQLAALRAAVNSTLTHLDNKKQGEDYRALVSAMARSLLQGLVGPLKGAPRWEHLTQLYGTETRQRGFDTDLTNYTKYVHAMGLKVGLYTSKGDEKCANWWPPASGHFEKTDAAAFAKWGVDFVKYDNCKTQNYADEAAATMAAALKAASSSTGKPIVFLDGTPAYYVEGGEMGSPYYYLALEFLRNNGVPQLRIGSDIVEYPYLLQEYQKEFPGEMPSPHPWSSPIKGPGEAGVFAAFRQGALLGRYTAPGHWNDLDYLMIGDNGLTSDEEQSQMSLWAILGSPLIVSSDMRKLRDAYFDKLEKQKYFNTSQLLKDHLERSVKILMNKDAIAIDQDKLGAGGYIIQETSQEQDKGYVIAARPLSGGGLAVVVLNKGSKPLPSLDVSLEQLGYTSSGNIRFVVHDVWQNKDEVFGSGLGRININELPPHASRLYRISGALVDGKTPVLPKPRGLIMNNYSPPIKDGAGNKRHNSTLCWQVSKTAQPGTQVELGYCNGDVAQTWIRDMKTNTIKLAGIDLCLSSKENSYVTLESCIPSSQDTKTQQFHYYINGMIQAGERKPADNTNLRPSPDSQCLKVKWEGNKYSKGDIVTDSCNSEIYDQVLNRTDANNNLIYANGYRPGATNFMWAMPLSGEPSPQ